MSNVLQEVTDTEITPAHVAQRVDDWVDRIDALYAEIAGWLPGNWTAARQRTVRMDEEMMRKFGIPARDLPVLDLLQGGRRAASVEPRGLWIIGANGRLDLTTHKGHYVILDVAENFASPEWRIAPVSDRRCFEVFDRTKLQAVL